METIRKYIEQNGYLLFDGAMGTYYASLPRKEGKRPEKDNTDDPGCIASIHTAYLEAGCRAIKTNTFSLGTSFQQGEEKEASELLKAGAKVALDAAGPFGAYVFADMGPVSGDEEEVFSVLCREAELFLEAGLTCFLLETQSAFTGTARFAAALKEKCPEAFLLVSFAAGPDGMTADGLSARELIEWARKEPCIDAVGLNCYSGPGHMWELIRRIPSKEGLFSVMPNAGYPSAHGRRTVYSGSPSYFAETQKRMYAHGVRILGGCCGTTPEHIRAVFQELKDEPVPVGGFSFIPPAEPLKIARENPVRKKLFSGEKYFAVEYDPPREDDLASYMEGVKEIAAAGADAVTIADCPTGVPRIDSCLLACRLKRELGLEAIPHVACRDRNLNAIKALLLGLSAEDLHTVLLVTGDPVPVDLRDKIKGVFNCNSRRLASFVRTLTGEGINTPFTMLGALNVNAVNFDSELRLAKEKEENGVECFLTQPILSPEAVENLKKARQRLSGKILAGIYPPVSYRNACFLNNEIGGIRVCHEIIESYKDLSRTAAENWAVEVSLQTARVTADCSDGWYIMTPFSRTSLVARILTAIKEEQGTAK